jgi:glycosyltransferase involved in cell wall biosynthesis
MVKDLTQTNVIIPVYNEGRIILKTIRNINASLKENYIIQICYDHDHDNTISAVRSSNLPNKSKIIFTKNKYFGPHGAVMTGLYSLTAKYSIVIPADDDINSKKLNLMLDLANGGVDIVCPSRFMKGGKMIGAPILKSIINRTVNFILYRVANFPTADATNGFRLFSSKVIEDIPITSKHGFTYSLEYLAKAYERDYVIKELPSVWVERNAGKSRFMLSKWWLSYLYWFIFSLKVGILKRINFNGTK